MLISDVPREDWRQLFEGTVMFSKVHGWGVITEVLGVTVSFTPCDGERSRFEIEFNDENFKIDTPMLGFANIQGQAVYLSRLPKRIMKAGICIHDLKMAYPKVGVAIARDIPFHLSRNSCNLIPMFEGEYPSFEEALSFVSKNPNSVMAYDRQFAISSDFRIFYKDIVVGAYTVEDGIVFNKDFNNLKYSQGNYRENLQKAKQAARQRVGGN